jgi:hypothetical protein
MLIAAGLLALLQSCIPSIYPLYTEDTVVFEKMLIGKWTEDNSDTWVFEQGQNNLFERNKEKSYRLTYQDEKDKLIFEAHLVKLDKYYFFDFYLLTDENDTPDMQAIAPLVPTHGFAKVEFTGNEMKLLFFNYEWLEKLIKQKRIRIKHETLKGGTVLLTAPTEELQKFVVKYAEEKDAYIDPLILTRIVK